MSDTPPTDETAPSPAEDAPEGAPAADPNAPVSNYSTDGRPRTGCIFVIIPVGFAGAILVAYLVLFGFGSMGFDARGDRVRMAYDTCPDARPLIEARVDMMGLGEARTFEDGGHWVVEATLPATPAADTIPATLARRGDFAIRAGDAVSDPVVIDHGVVDKAAFSLKEMGNPLVVVTLNQEGHETLEAHMEAHNDGQISMWVDTERVVVRPNDPPFRRTQIDIRAEGPDGQDNMRRAVDWAMLMTHGPLPCEAELVGVETVE